MKTAILLIFAASVVAAQPIGQATSVVRGASLPTSCQVGQVWFQGNSSSGSLYTCTAANTWTASGGSGSASIACVGTPGNTTGTYRQVCQTSAGALYACNNAAGCTVAADWVAQGGGGLTCYSGTISYTSINAAAATMEISTGQSLTGKFFFENFTVQELTQFTSGSVTALTVSAGHITGTDSDLLPAFTLMQATAPQNYWPDRPSPPLLGSGTYTPLLYFSATGGNLGNGTTSNLTAGSLYWTMCGHLTP